MYTLPNGIPIDLDLLELTMQESDPSSCAYVNLHTGEIVVLSDLEEKKREEIIWSEQHVLIERVSSEEAYHWREAFVAQMVAPQDQRVAQRLAHALAGRDPFQRFKRTLRQVGDAWVQAWYQWNDEQLHDHMQRWRASLPTTVDEREPLT